MYLSIYVFSLFFIWVMLLSILTPRLLYTSSLQYIDLSILLLDLLDSYIYTITYASIIYLVSFGFLLSRRQVPYLSSLWAFNPHSYTPLLKFLLNHSFLYYIYTPIHHHQESGPFKKYCAAPQSYLCLYIIYHVGMLLSQAVAVRGFLSSIVHSLSRVNLYLSTLIYIHVCDYHHPSSLNNGWWIIGSVPTSGAIITNS